MPTQPYYELLGMGQTINFFPAYICGTVLSTHKLSCKDVIIQILKKIKEEKSVVNFFFVQVGEGEKLVRALFAVARELQPSIIFIGKQV